MNMTKVEARSVTVSEVQIQKIIVWSFAAVVAIASTHPAFAGGTDTATSGWNSVKSWLDTWIPLMCTVAVMGISLAWGVLHMVRFDVAWKAALGLIGCGSAAYIVSFFVQS